MAWNRLKNYIVQYLGKSTETPFIKVTWLDHLADFDWTKQSFTGATNIYQPLTMVGPPAVTNLFRDFINTTVFPDGNYCIIYYTDNAGTINPEMQIEYFSTYQGSPAAVLNPTITVS